MSCNKDVDYKHPVYYDCNMVAIKDIGGCRIWRQ